MGFPWWVIIMACSQSSVMVVLWNDSLGCFSIRYRSVTPPSNILRKYRGISVRPIAVNTQKQRVKIKCTVLNREFLTSLSDYSLDTIERNQIKLHIKAGDSKISHRPCMESATCDDIKIHIRIRIMGSVDQERGHYSAKKRYWNNAGIMLAQRLRCWTNTKPTLAHVSLSGSYTLS